jgi:hypothetical protein
MMVSDQGMDIVPGADSQSQPIMLATGHFWRHPSRLCVEAQGGQFVEPEPTGSEPKANQQAALTWCDSEN